MTMRAARRGEHEQGIGSRLAIPIRAAARLRTRTVLIYMLLVSIVLSTVLGGSPARATTPGAPTSQKASAGAAGVLSAWGMGGAGELAVDPAGLAACALNTPCSMTPVATNGGPSNVTALAAGSSHSMALTSDGRVWTWGANYFGELGNVGPCLLPSTQCFNATPQTVTIPSSSLAIGIAAGTNFSLALLQDGSVWAWGANYWGQLGNKSLQNSAVPVPVSGLGPGSGVIAIAAGRLHSLALKSDGTVWAWGNNSVGQLGVAQPALLSEVPVEVSGLGPDAAAKVTAIAAGGAHSLALKSDGTVWAWGSNVFGQLGQGATSAITASNTPVPVMDQSGNPLTGVEVIAAGDSHSLALLAPPDAARVMNGVGGVPGTVVGWGLNYQGELGNGSTATSGCSCIGMAAPVIGGNGSALTGVTAIAAGGTHSLAITQDGSAWAWGNNATGQLGSVTSALFSAVPVQVSGLSGVSAVAAGGTFSVALGSTLVDVGATATALAQVAATQTAVAAAQQTATAQSAATQTAAAQQTASAAVQQTANAAQTAAAASQADAANAQATANAAQTAAAAAQQTAAAPPPGAGDTAAQTATAAAETAATQTAAAVQSRLWQYHSYVMPPPVASTGQPHGKVKTRTHSRLFLVLIMPKRGIVGGTLFSPVIKTAPRTQVTVTLRVYGTTMELVGKGKRRHKVLVEVILFQVTRGGFADSHGLYRPHLPITFRSLKRTQAALTVTVGTSTDTLTQTFKETIKPPVVGYKLVQPEHKPTKTT